MLFKSIKMSDTRSAKDLLLRAHRDLFVSPLDRHSTVVFVRSILQLVSLIGENQTDQPITAVQSWGKSYAVGSFERSRILRTSNFEPRTLTPLCLPLPVLDTLSNRIIHLLSYLDMELLTILCTARYIQLRYQALPDELMITSASPSCAARQHKRACTLHIRPG